jgi:diaminopimelate decarboxylase
MMADMTSEALLGLFPEGTELDDAGQLVVGGVLLRDVAERYGTPAYVVDSAALRRTVRRFRAALARSWPNSRVVFASKSFPCVAAYRLMAEEGLAMDVAGGGELAAALRAGVAGADLVLHGNAKTTLEIQAAVQAGAGLIVIDNFDDIDRLEQVIADVPSVSGAPSSGVQDVLVRVLPGVDPQTHEAVATGQNGSKFGLPPDEAKRAIERIRRSDRLRLAGIHTHIGSQLLTLEPFRAAVQVLADLGEFETYDLGGGLGARYTYADQPPTPEEWISALTDAAREYLPSSARLLIEPGRSLVARSGLTLYRVVSIKRVASIKRGGGRTIVAVDGGMADNLEVALFGQRFEATVVDRVGGGEPVDLVGRHCESGDRLSSGVPLREPVVGDVIAIPVTGAYCYTMANNYNGALKAPVLFCADGVDQLVVRRETYDDYFRRDETHNQR